MQKFTYLFAVIFFLLVSCQPSAHDPFEEEEGENEFSKQEAIQGAIDYYKRTSSDIETGEIPYDKLLKAIDIGRERVAERTKLRSGPGSITSPVWRERGPNNRGGRTRAIMIDSMNHNRIWIGSVSGGLWRTEDITQTDPQWQKLGIYFENLSISDICQDPNDFTTIYVSTGESYYGDIPQGTGIFKSTDDGATWTLMPSTTGTFNALAEINEIYIHTNGDIYALTSQGGLLRSQDGGNVWEKVAGLGINSATNDNFHDFYFSQVNQTFYACNSVDIMKSTTGNRNEWFSIGRSGMGFMDNVSRVEMAICPSDPDMIYAIGNVGGFSSNTFVTKDGGATWSSRSVPEIFGGYGQASYDLDIAVDPFNCSRILAGGVDLSESTFQAFSWHAIVDIHPDQHNITFDPDIPDRILFSNDGGIWFSTNGGANTVDKSQGYVTTQFYCSSIHPDAGSPYIIGGTQDNNSLIIEETGLSPSRVAIGGDGMFCFIDQVDPRIQIVSYQGGQYSLSTNGGQSFGFGASIDGEFVNRSGYDSRAHILYGQLNDPPAPNPDTDFFRWQVSQQGSGLVDNCDISNFEINVSAVLADPNVPNRIYFGGNGGIVLRIDNANQGTSFTATKFADLPSGAEVSCIYMDKQTSNDALISLFSFGASLENIWMTKNAGADWVSIEGDLPDLPVRWAIFDPADHDKAMIATNAGVWATDDIDGANTHWIPTNPDNGLPFVRTDMLLLRDSDKVVLAATYGRGMMTTDVFATPAAVIVTQPIAYKGQSVLIDGTSSVNAESYLWDLGDSNTSTEAKVNHVYEAPGNYTIKLTINGSLVQTKKISILPYLPAPYQEGEPGYAGDFETTPEHFAGYSQAGSSFSLGISDKPGKDGTHSGTKAWVLDPNNNLYQNNSRAELYTPMYDLTTPALYELKFWTKFAVENRNDGFQIEYSLNGGATWTQLGTKDDTGWYNYHNTNLSDGAFPVGKSYFTNAQLTWTQYIKDVSFLVGQATVSFRFVFRSDDSGPAQGLAIDDFEVSKYDGELKTTITEFNADYTADQTITMNWTTGIEYLCQKISIWRSYSGIEYDSIKVLNAQGVTSTFPHSYTTTIPELKDVSYYYLKAINYSASIPGSYYEVYSDTIVVRRNVESDIVQHVVTNPFRDKIYVSFSSEINQAITARLFDMAGQLIREEVVIPNTVTYTMDGLDLLPGVYMFSIQIGEGETKSWKLLTMGN
ncbi:MAG TPA: PKD domain-containing protein [Saprospiraceae bacterium]|nr:PKD domain-containing protein [Saprospiraceae bacterium]